MGKVFKFAYLVFCMLLLFYLLLPAPSMPKGLPNSVKSTEPADLEEPSRVGYFTDMTREEVVNFYQSEFTSDLPTVRLRDYPPEEARVLIRDQTQSTFLEELVHPMRESLYINGYEPSADKNPLVVAGKKWKQKIIIKYVQSNVVIRVVVALATLGVGYLLIFEWKRAINVLK